MPTMSDDLHFAENYRDLCQQSGTGAGFQFEFYCECCNDTWRSPFTPYLSGQASGWMQRASGLVGSLLGNIGSDMDNAVQGLAQSGWGTARDTAFREAIAAAQGHFHRCARCHHYTCDRCWSIDSGLCRNCAPDIASEVQAARLSGTLEAATTQARSAGTALADKVDVTTPHQLCLPKVRCRSAWWQVLPAVRARSRRARELCELPCRIAGRQSLLSGMRSRRGA